MYGTGIDICEVARFERLEENEAFLDRVFTAKEKRYCQNRKKSAEAFAARFAAKEAFSKAMGSGIAAGLHLTEIEVENDKNGKPILILHGETKKSAEEKNITRIHLSMTHEKSVAAAVVILESSEK